jgi:hypothetical protein
MPGRLRPIGLEERGLPDAIENIAGFWRRRRSQVDFLVRIGEGLPTPA